MEHLDRSLLVLDLAPPERAGARGEGGDATPRSADRRQRGRRVNAPLFQPSLFAEPEPPRVTVTLRPYQTTAVAELDTRAVPGARILCVAPTGAGKTTIFCRLVADALACGGRCLVIAHRTELISQAYGRLITSGVPEHQVGVIMADGVIVHPITGRRVNCARPLAAVQVASIDTLRNRLKAAKPPGVTLVIIDECHRALAKSYRDVFDAYPDAVHLGFTATPYRGDGRGLGDVYRELLVVTTPKTLMAEGFLSEPRVFSHPKRADLSKVQTVAGDYDQEQLAEACDKRELVGSIVEHWHRHLEGVRTVAFSVNVAHAIHIAEEFRAAGVPAEPLDGETKPEERAAILARLDRGETLVVANCNVLTEGWDQPSAKGCILAAPTKSRAKYIQQAGRVLRPWNGVMPVILDHAGCVLEHDLPQADWEFSLDGKKRRAKSKVSVKECPVCFGAVPSQARTCTYCGNPFVAADSECGEPPSERDGQLVEVKVDSLRALQLQTKAARAELQDWAQRVDREINLEPGTVNGLCKRQFRKSRSEMGPDDLVKVREWFLSRWPWLAEAPEPPPPPAPRPPLRFEAPIAEAQW